MRTANPAMTMRTITNIPIDGIVLAGGLSSRMGRDKAQRLAQIGHGATGYIHGDLAAGIQIGKRTEQLQIHLSHHGSWLASCTGS